MTEPAKRYQDALPRLKKNVETSFNFFKTNYQRWHDFSRFVLLTSLTDKDLSVLNALGKPTIEFNILEAYCSRLRGEFSKQEPSIEVMADYDQPVDPQTINVVEGHFRHIECESRHNGTAYRVFSDALIGGFSVLEVFTEYANEKSMNQVIKCERVFDPTLCFFDPLAQQIHKSDSRYWGKVYPKSKEDFKDEFPNINIDEIKFSKNIEGFNWSYNQEKEDVLLICDYYEKKTKKTKIVQLADGQTLTMEEYDKFIQDWDNAGMTQQAPRIIKERYSQLPTICRYRFIENQVLEYVETDFKYPNLIFVDGNSAYIRDNVNGAMQQHTRPYVYHAKGIQKLKNVAGQTIAHNIENQVQHKFKVAKEAIPPEFADVYKDVQHASTLVFNAFKDNDPNIPLPAPQEIAVVPAPPENMNMYAMTDQTAQAILGSYDASLGINDNQLSGVAIVEGATQSNSAAMPYVVSYMQALNQAAQVMLDLIPKYYVTPRTIPVVDKNGKRSYVPINQDKGVSLKYNENALSVKVEAGVNFAIQKSRALQQIIAMAQAMPIFAQFAQQPGVLRVLLDNFEIRGVDQLKELADQFTQQIAQQQQAAQNQPNPMMIKLQNEQANIQREATKDQMTGALKQAELSLKNKAIQNDTLALIMDAQKSQNDNAVEMDKHNTEKLRAGADMAMSVADMHHRHSKDTHELAHKINMDHLTHEASESNIREKQENE